MLTPKNQNVAKYVERYWFIEKKQNDGCCQHPKLNPDPAAHIILAPPSQAYSYTQEGQLIQGTGSHWIFPYCETFQLDHTKPFLIVGIKFHVGALYSLDVKAEQPAIGKVLPVNLKKLLNQADFNESTVLTLATLHPDKCCDMLDSLLINWLRNNTENTHSQLCRKVLPLLSTHPIAELGNRLNCSQRTLERSFRRVTGLTLKQCQSMNNLETLLEYLYQKNSNEIDWVEVAYKFGFSDQPHLIRYFKTNIGKTPNNYLTERGLTIDIYGGVHSD